jgi:nitroreductase
MTAFVEDERAVRVHPLLSDRRSPRSFDPSHEVDDQTLLTLLEAARWAPSSMNRQPWRFVVARRGTTAHDEVMAALNPGNQVWAGDASVLVVAIAERSRDGVPLTTADYDLALSVAQLGVQAHALDLHTHQMGGFDSAALSRTLELDESLDPVVVVALGRRDAAHRLPEHLRTRETAKRTRRPLSDLVLSVDGQAWPQHVEDDAAAASAA